tara:strand:- start:280 stop:447 length:168 start_codon:yes stop_codon:yes gene_type:complete
MRTKATISTGTTKRYPLHLTCFNYMSELPREYTLYSQNRLADSNNNDALSVVLIE